MDRIAIRDLRIYAYHGVRDFAGVGLLTAIVCVILKKSVDSYL